MALSTAPGSIHGACIRRRAAILLGLIVAGECRGQAVRGTPGRDTAWFDRERSVSIAVENDAFGFGGTDASYTQGLRVLMEFARAPRAMVTLNRFLAPARRPRSGARAVAACTQAILAAADTSGRECLTVGFALTQTQFTPANILDSILDPSDRPYAGLLTASVAATLRWKDASALSEVSVGVIGPLAFAEQTQSLAHWTWSFGSPRPLGWRNQLRTAPLVSLRTAYAKVLGQLSVPWPAATAVPGGKRPVSRVRVFDAQVSPEIIVGTVMQRASVGARLRAGWNIDRTPAPSPIPATLLNDAFAAVTPDIVSPIGLTGKMLLKSHVPAVLAQDTASYPLVKADRLVAPVPSAASQKVVARADGNVATRVVASVARNVWGQVFAGGTVRAVGGNALLSGSRWADTGPTGWRTVHQLDIAHGVMESALGWTVGWRRFSVTQQWLWRSNEFHSGAPWHSFGSLAVAMSSRARPSP
ncbi:MAG: lipid A deacylase LpxR family protein [Gemmatimonadaceae bacterium]|nr:lipid A deacylase LpxR family protein [Gemmatimonadaceae bacterium]